MFIAAGFTKATTWKKPKCPLVNGSKRKNGTYLQCNATQLPACNPPTQTQVLLFATAWWT